MKKLCLALLIVAMGFEHAVAATKYWDINGATAGAGGATPAETWSTGGGNWTTDSTGGSAATTWASGDDAVFSAGSDATGSFTVTITTATTVTANSVKVEEGTILLGPGTIAFGAVNGVFDVASGAHMNISGTGSGLITGTGGITKNGLGLLSLGGSESYSRSSGAILTINAGIADFSGDTALGAAPGSARVNAVTINGGTLRYSGTAGLTLAANRGITIGASGGTIQVPELASIGGLQLSSTAGTLSGSGLLTKTGTGRFTINSSSSTFSGKYNITSGLINVLGDSQLGAVPGSVTSDYFTMSGGGGLRIGTTGSPITVNANRGITLGTGGGKLIQPGPGTLTYNGIIAGTGGLTVDWQDAASTSAEGGAAGGTVVLGGLSTFSGTTTINTGATLKLGAAGVIPDASVVTATGTLDLNGFDETIGGLAGAGTVRNGVAGTKTLTVNQATAQTFSGILSSGTGTLNLVKQGAGVLTLSGTSTFTGTTTINSGGAILASNASSLGTAAIGTTVNSGGQLQPSGAITIAEPLTISGTGLATDGAIRKLGNNATILSGGITLAANASIFNGNTSGSSTLTIQTGTVAVGANILTFGGGSRPITVSAPIAVSTGSIIKDSSLTAALTLSGATTLSGSAAIEHNGTGTFTISGGIGVSGAGQNLEFGVSNGSSTITVNTSAINIGTGTLTKDGSGTVRLDTANTIGAVTFNNGNFNIANAGAFGSGVVTVNVAPNTGSFTAAGSQGNVNVVNDMFLSLGSDVYLSPAGGTPATNLIFSGIIDGPGALRRGLFNGNGGGLMTLSGANTFGGGVVIERNELILGNKTALGSGTFQIGNGTPAAIITIDSNTNLTGADAVANNVTIEQSFTWSGLAGNDLEFSGPVTLTGSPTITVTNVATSTISGSISGTGFGITKAGASTLTLTAANTYTGTTTVNAGTLQANNTTGSATGTGAVIVNADGTLSGSGSVAGSVTVNAAGHLAPGNSPGVLTIGDTLADVLTFAASGIFDYQIDSSAALAAAADLVDLSGDLSIAATATLAIADAANVFLTPGTKFTLIGYDGTWNGGTFASHPDNSLLTVGANLFVLDYDDITRGVNFVGVPTSNHYVTILAVVPEPSAFLFGALICAAVGLAYNGNKLLTRAAAVRAFDPVI